MPFTSIDNNSFKNSTVFGVSVKSCPNGTITITNNQIKNTGTSSLSDGIICTDEVNSNVVITGNIIDQNPSNQVTTGIKVQNSNPGKMVLDIDMNIIKSKFTSISLTRVEGTVQNQQPIISNNSITINSPATSPGYYGIRAQFCKFVKIGDNNTINTTGIVVSSAYQQTLRGISVEQSTNSTVSKNIVNNMGAGIFCDGTDNNSWIACNQFNGCYNGVFFMASTNIGGQLPNSPPF
jgi:hypothetical protein